MPTLEDRLMQKARAICKQGQLHGVIVIGIDEDGRVGGASYGATVRQCKQLGPWLNEIVDNAGLYHDLSAFAPASNDGGDS